MLTITITDPPFSFVADTTETVLNFTVSDQVGPAGPTGSDGAPGGLREVKSASFTAANDTDYTATATLTVTDPTPVQGKGFSVFVRNGTATVGGTAYATAGTIIERVYHSGAWSNNVYRSAGNILSADISDATSAATASKIVLRDATGGASFAATTGNAVEGTATSGIGVSGISDTGYGGSFTTTGSGVAASFFSFLGDIAEFGNSEYGTVASISWSGSISTVWQDAYIQSRSTFKLFDGTYTTTVSHSPTADRAIAFPNAGGTVALTSGSQTFSDTQTFSGTLSVTGSFTTSGVINGGGLDISQTWNRPTITVTGASGNGTTATLTFASQASAIPVGATIVVASVNPSGYNATAVVTASTLTSVSYLNATSATYVSGGNITQLFTGIRANFTDTASNASSNLIDLQVGGTSRFKVDKGGVVDITNTLGRNFRFSGGNLIPTSSGVSNLGGVSNIFSNVFSSKLSITEGANASVGLATLVAGTVVVNTTAVTANSRIFLTRQTTAGTIGTSVDVTAKVAGTSFTITSNGSILDTSTVAWLIIN